MRFCGFFNENFADFHDHSELPIVNSQELEEFDFFYVLPFMLFDNVRILLVCIPLTRVAGPDPTSA